MDPIEISNSLRKMASISTEPSNALVKPMDITCNHYTRLCKECQQLDLDQSFAEAFEFYKSAREGRSKRRHGLHGNAWEPLYYENAHLVHHFHDRLSRPSNCSMCSFFRTMRSHGDSYRNSKLLAFCSSEDRLFCPPQWKKCWSRQQFKHTVFMAVLPDFDPIPPNGENTGSKEISRLSAQYIASRQASLTIQIQSSALVNLERRPISPLSRSGSRYAACIMTAVAHRKSQTRER